MNSGFSFFSKGEFSLDILELFQKGRYEEYVFEIMCKSQSVFPGEYRRILNQAHGECDFIDSTNGQKFDAKLPFSTEQIEMLTDGKRHSPNFKGWIRALQNEAAEYNLQSIRDGTFDITKTQLFLIMKSLIIKDNGDENFIFFFPYPISLSVRDGIFVNLATDYLLAISNKLYEERILSHQAIYAVYPSIEKNCFAVRNLKNYCTEFVECERLGRYFSYEVIGITH